MGLLQFALADLPWLPERQKSSCNVSNLLGFLHLNRRAVAQLCSRDFSVHHCFAKGEKGGQSRRESLWPLFYIFVVGYNSNIIRILC